MDILHFLSVKFLSVLDWYSYLIYIHICYPKGQELRNMTVIAVFIFSSIVTLGTFSDRQTKGQWKVDQILIVIFVDIRGSYGRCISSRRVYALICLSLPIDWLSFCGRQMEINIRESKMKVHAAVGQQSMGTETGNQYQLPNIWWIPGQ